MIKIYIMKQKPTSTRPASKCQFWLRMLRGNSQVKWQTETYTRRSTALRAAKAMRDDLKNGCKIFLDNGTEA
jgi:uncharacterized protein YegP (UPF0339 family)